MPVPIAEDCQPSDEIDSRPLILVWNHRWEYDKGPDRLWLLMRQLVDNNIDFRIHIIGQVFRQQPQVFGDIKREFSQYILSFGFVKRREKYVRVLQKSHVVISTALHEFQGLAVMEAVACGCLPLVPDRLAYQEYYHEDYRYPSYLNDAEEEARLACEYLIALLSKAKLKKSRVEKCLLKDVSWTKILPCYEKIFNQ